MGDIASAAGASLDDLVACLVNVRPGINGSSSPGGAAYMVIKRTLSSRMTS